MADESLSLCLSGRNFSNCNSKGRLFFLHHRSPRLTLLLLNQYKSFLIVALIEAVWFKYCTRECNFHRSVVKLLSTVFRCNNVTRFIFQAASGNIRTVFSHPCCYDFHTILWFKIW